MKLPLGNLIAPSRTTYDSISLLLTASTEAERDALTEQWRDHKLEEQNFIGIIGALLAGCLTNTGSWPTILHNGRSMPWTVPTCWYTGIVYPLFAVLTAALQSICLHRLSAHKHGLRNIRRVITASYYGERGGGGGEAETDFGAGVAGEYCFLDTECAGDDIGDVY